MPGYVLLGDDGVFRLGDDDASSVDEKRTKRVVSAVPRAPGQVYGGTQVGSLSGGQPVGHMISLADVRHDGRRQCLAVNLDTP